MPMSKSVVFAFACLGLGAVACGSATDVPGEVTGTSEQAVLGSGPILAPPLLPLPMTCSYVSVTNWAAPVSSPNELSCEAQLRARGLGCQATPSGECRAIKASNGKLAGRATELLRGGPGGW